MEQGPWRVTDSPLRLPQELGWWVVCWAWIGGSQGHFDKSSHSPMQVCADSLLGMTSLAITVHDEWCLWDAQEPRCAQVLSLPLVLNPAEQRPQLGW